MKNLTILSVVISLFVGACIRKECRDIPGGYEFEIPVTLSPAKDTFRVGDTISIVSTFDDMVFERKTQQRYLLENWDFYPITDIHKIDTAPYQNGIPFFDVIVSDNIDYRQFTFSDGWSSFTGAYSYNRGYYTLSYKVLPKESGLYCIYQASAQSINDNQDFPGKCSGISSRTAVVLNDNVDNNIEFLEESPDTFISEWIPRRPMDRFYDGGGYCFYVIE
jgi:hypothetical protein